MLVTQGATVIAARTDGAVAERARTLWPVGRRRDARAVRRRRPRHAVPARRATRSPACRTSLGPSNPLGKTVRVEPGAWRANYAAMPWMIVAPMLAIIGSVRRLSGARTQGQGARHLRLEPRDLRHHLDRRPVAVPVPDAVLGRPAIELHGVGRVLEPDDAVHHAAARRCVFLPIILAYTAWVYRVMRGTGDDDEPQPQSQRLLRSTSMWYFSWILGVGLACSFGILNAMWYELREPAPLRPINEQE